MFRPDWVVTTCGNQKMSGPGRADQFYTGSFVREQGWTAEALSPKRGRLILSNKYGLIPPDYIIPGPYDSHWGYEDTIREEELAWQVESHSFKAGEVVLSLGAEVYAETLRRILPKEVIVLWPAKLLQDRRMGFQKELHKRLRTLKALPDGWLSTARI